MSNPAVFPERPRVAVPCACVLGEGPIWDHRTGTLLWVDVKDDALFAWDPHGHAKPELFKLPEAVGFVVLTPEPDHVLVGLKSGIARLDRRDGSLAMLLDPEPDRPTNRLNDACVGPDGSMYFGTMDDAETADTGSFYRWSPAGLAPFGGNAVVTNGPAVDSARRLLYATNTTEGRVYRHALEPGGLPGEGEVFVQFEPGWGHPDGMAVDAESHLWVCHFGGARITRFAPDGTPVLVLPMPTAQVSKVAFGGPDLKTLYITTAARGRDRQIDPFAGDVLVLDVDVAGVAAEICTMGTP